MLLELQKQKKTSHPTLTRFSKNYRQKEKTKKRRSEEAHEQRQQKRLLDVKRKIN